MTVDDKRIKDCWKEYMEKLMNKENENKNVSRPRGRPKKTWKEVVRENCQACKLNKEDAMDRCKWRKMITMIRMGVSG